MTDLFKLLFSWLRNLWQALLSSGAWALIWVFAFFGSTIIIDIFDGTTTDVTTSALTITAAVLSGHLAKLISYAIGCDTDFRHIFMNGPQYKNEPDFFRLIVSFIFLLIASTLLYQQISDALEPKKVVDTEFVLYSAGFWCVILCIFLAQMTFSWPDAKLADINDSTG